MKTVTVEEAFAAMEQAVTEHGPDTVRECSYVEYNDAAGKWEPHCIAGVALSKLGVPLRVLKALPMEQIDTEETVLLPLYEAGFEFEDDAVRALNEAQYQQDGSIPWGEALGHAKAMLDVSD